MELNDLKEIDITIDCDNEKTAQSVFNALRNALPNSEWAILDCRSGMTRYSLYQIVNRHDSLRGTRRPILQASSDIFAELFLKPKEEPKDQVVNGTPPIDWEQRRYEISRDILATALCLQPTEKDITSCLELADVLIDHLKQKEEC